MKKPFHPHHAALIAALLSLGITSAGAQNTVTLPQLRHSGTVEYIAGGIGQDEARAMREASTSWPLALEFASKGSPRADYVADVTVNVRDSRKQSVLEVKADGPFLLARLAPGRYTVDATYAGKTLSKTVTVARGRAARTLFLWSAAEANLK
jgi:hypothetical protein